MEKKEIQKKENKFIKFIKKNKLLSVLLLIFILIIILGLVSIKVLIFPSYSVDKYGDRLENIENVKITETRFNEIKTNFEDIEGFKIEKFEISGRIVNIYINVTDFSVNASKDKAQEIVNKFSEEEIKYYDFQVFITGDNESYPIIGYKNKKSDNLFWNYAGEN